MEVARHALLHLGNLRLLISSVLFTKLVLCSIDLPRRLHTGDWRVSGTIRVSVAVRSRHAQDAGQCGGHRPPLGVTAKDPSHREDHGTARHPGPVDHEALNAMNAYGHMAIWGDAGALASSVPSVQAFKRLGLAARCATASGEYNSCGAFSFSALHYSLCGAHSPFLLLHHLLWFLDFIHRLLDSYYTLY